MSLFSLLRRHSEVSSPTDWDVILPDVETSSNDRLLSQGRYGLLLDRDQPASVDEHTRAIAWLALEQEMAFLPAPDLGDDAGQQTGVPAALPIPALYLDRFATTNAQFARFVSAEGYAELDLWPQSIWPNLVQFVDSTGHPGPRFWKHGQPPPGKERHPVVGVNWFEARAYARWCGKRLPTAAEWEHAGSWSGGRDGRGPRARYPWGNTFDPRRTNTWAGGPGDTVPVDDYAQGATPNGVYQLVGNVWEWVATQYEFIPQEAGLRVAFEEPMVEIRGGAFDTYFETQATCHFRTGQPFLYRGTNVGFRCGIPADHLTDPPPPTAFA